jgi:hypothetical protein
MPTPGEAAWSSPDANGPVPAGEADADPAGRMPPAPDAVHREQPAPKPIGRLACRNRQVIRPNIYARSGILTHAISALPGVVVEHFPIAMVGNQIAEYLRLSILADSH